MTNHCQTITAAPSFVPSTAIGLQPADIFSITIDAMTFDADIPPVRVGFASNRDSFDSTSNTNCAWFIDVYLIGPEQYTSIATPRRPEHVLYANIGDIITMKWQPKNGILAGTKFGDNRTVATVSMPTSLDDGPYPCVDLRAAHGSSYTSGKREWALSQVTLTETPPSAL